MTATELAAVRAASHIPQSIKGKCNDASPSGPTRWVTLMRKVVAFEANSKLSFAWSKVGS